MGNRLAVTFYSTNTGGYEGQGYHMPNMETFINYVENELKAVKIEENKYKHPNRDSYICLEKVRI